MVLIKQIGIGISMEHITWNIKPADSAGFFHYTLVNNVEWEAATVGGQCRVVERTVGIMNG